MLLRDTRADAAVIDEESRRVRLSFSSEEPYLRTSWFDDPWIEVLGHGADEVDMSRLESGAAPVLYGHNSWERSDHIGIVERAWIENGKGYAEIRLSMRDELADLWRDIQDGIVRNVSVGYQIQERTLTKQNDGGPNEYRVTRWLPMEVSLVPIPADATVGVGRSADEPRTFTVTDIQEDGDMDRDVDTGAPAAVDQPETGMTRADVEKAARDAAKAERHRIVTIKREVTKAGLPASFADELAEKDMTIDEARAAIIDELAKGDHRIEPVGRVQLSADERDKFRTAGLNAVLFRAGLAKEADRDNEFRGYTLRELARFCLERANISTRGLSSMEMVSRAFMAHSTADFDYILENTARKAMLLGFTEAPESYERWTRRVPMSDFKTQSFVKLSGFSDLDEVGENAEYTHGTLTDFREQAALATYGKLFSITRQAIINDDLSAFSDIPRAMGRAARRKIGDLAYAVLTANANMSDGNPLFSAAHSNFVDNGSGAPPSVTTLLAAETAMSTQTDPNSGAALNIEPKYLIVPRALAGNARVLVSAQYDPDTANKLQKPNPVAPMNLEVVPEARLDADDPAAWYVAADPNLYDTVVIGYFNEEPEPVLEQKEGWNVDGTEFKVRIDGVAKAVDWRGLYFNDGN
jgi:phage major head subunit gpT-like protein